MDVQRLTTLARETLSVAIRQTSAAGNPTVEPIHLLSALLAQPEDDVAEPQRVAGAQQEQGRQRDALRQHEQRDDRQQMDELQRLELLVRQDRPAPEKIERRRRDENGVHLVEASTPR